MSMDILQEKIRKLKNPSVIDMTVSANQIPPSLLDGAISQLEANKRFVSSLLEALYGIVPAVRFSFNIYALDGAAGLCVLDELLHLAKQKGYYVFLDAPAMLSQSQAELCAKTMLDTNCNWEFDSLLVSTYLGSDTIRPYAQLMEGTKKSLFALVRSANKSAPEIQDLLTGSRLVHAAAAEILDRFSTPSLTCRNGYCNIGALASATAPESLKTLRAKHSRMFLFVDGYDQPSANAKNCSVAFDKLGHGAVVCAGSSISAAWLDQNDNGEDYAQLAAGAAERMKKNLTRYISIL